MKKTRFGRGYGPVVRLTTGSTNYEQSRELDRRMELAKEHKQLHAVVLDVQNMCWLYCINIRTHHISHLNGISLLSFHRQIM